MMTDKQKAVIVFVLVLSTAICGITVMTMCLLYRTTIRLEAQGLQEIVQSHADLIEQAVECNRSNSDIHYKDTPEVFLSKIRHAHKHKEPFGRTGELVLSGVKDKQVILLSGKNYLFVSQPSPISMHSEPMRQALSIVPSGIFGGER